MTPPTELPLHPSSIVDSRREQIFPRLNQRQLAVLAAYGEHRRYPAGATLYEEGRRHVAMYVVLSGSVDVTRRTAAGDELLATHGPRVFTGEVGQLAGHAAIATCRARDDCEVLVITEHALHRLVVAEAELSDRKASTVANSISP